jgi:hypothetical protein
MKTDLQNQEASGGRPDMICFWRWLHLALIPYFPISDLEIPVIFNGKRFVAQQRTICDFGAVSANRDQTRYDMIGTEERQPSGGFS